MKAKQIAKQKQTVYFSKKITFKKESETIETAIKDKQIEKKKKVIINLLKTHSTVNDELSATKMAYQAQRQSYEKMRSELKAEQSLVYSGLMRLKIRKYRIQALEDPKIKDHFGNQIRKYLNGWAEANKHNIIISLGGIENYKIAKKYARIIEMSYSLRPKLAKIVLIKHQTILNQSCKVQSIIICVKAQSGKETQENSYKLQIYSTNGKYFYLSRILSKEEFETKIPRYNPFKNLYVQIKKNRIMFLDEYFREEGNVEKIERILKIYKFQIEVLKEKNKYVFFRVLTIKNFFQSVYKVEGYKNLELRVLLGIKKKEITRQIMEDSAIYSSGPNRKLNKYGKEKGLRQTPSQKIERRFCLYCQPVVAYDSKYMFAIEDENLLKNYENCPQNFLEDFQKNYLIQLVVKRSTLKDSLGISQEMKRKKHSPEYDFEDRVKKFHKQLIRPRIVNVIDFSSQTNMKKIIKIQSSLKMRLLKKKYSIESKRLKKEGLFRFSCKIEGNIMICSFIKGENLMYFVECLSLSAERKRERNQYLQYDKRYWQLAEEFMKSEQIVRIGRKYLVWEIQEEISLCFEEIIQKYEEQQQKINLMKPIKALNRLRRLFIRAILRAKRKANICFVKKIQKDFGSLVLIMRKSPYLKNIIQAELCVLKIKDPNAEQNRLSNKDKQRPDLYENKLAKNKAYKKETEIISKQQKSHKQIVSPMKKLRYQIISMFAQNVNKFVAYIKETKSFYNSELINDRFKKASQKCIESEFYITETIFLLKPLHIQYITGELKFIQRFASISIVSEEILNQIQNLSFAKSSGQSFHRDQIRNTILKEKSILRGSKKSSSSIIFQKSEIFPERENSDKNLVFYSLYKDKSSMFFLQLFVITENATVNSFKQVYKEEISKKEISTFGWTFIYKIIASWVQSSGRCISYQQYFNPNRRDALGYYYIASNKGESFAEECENSWPGPEAVENP